VWQVVINGWVTIDFDGIYNLIDLKVVPVAKLAAFSF